MKSLVFVAALMGFTAVGLGAFGAHALSEQFSSDAKRLWDTAGFYLLPHAVAVFVIARGTKGHLAGWLMGLGALIFAASLFSLALGAPSWFGAITPIGGILMLAGWVGVGISALTGDEAKRPPV